MSKVCFYVCVHVNNPSLTVPHVVSLTAPTKTAPVGSNPFEDDEDEEEEEEEEMAVEQQTTVNHNSVKKEEIKTLVNRRKKHLRPTHNLPRLFLFLSLFRGSPFLPFLVLGYSLYSLPLSLKPSLLPQVAGCCVALHGQWNCIAHKASVCLSFAPNSAMFCRTLKVMRMEAHVSAAGNPNMSLSYSQI